MSDGIHALIVRTACVNGPTRAGREFRDRLGYSDAELATKPLLDWIHLEDRPAIEAALQAGQGTVKARHATRSGDWIPISWQIRREGDEAYVLGQLCCDRPPAPGAWSRQPAGKEPINQMLATMALIVESKNPGKRCSILLIDPENNRIALGGAPSFPDEYNDAVEGLQIGPTVGSCGTAAFWNVPVIVEDIGKDPLWRDLRDAAKLAGVQACWSHPIRATDGSVLGAMALYSDTPSTPEQYQMDGLEIAAHMVGLAIERDRLEAQLRQAAKMEALGVLAGGVAHDFNNLFAVIVGNAELVISLLPDGSDERGMLEDIVLASVNATGLCNQMLACAGRGARSTESVECNALIRELSKLLQTSLSKKAVLQLDLEGEFFVKADRSQLRQVIMNLITNAAEAIGDSDGEVIVTTRGRQLAPAEIAAQTLPDHVISDDFIEISVSDSGCGMSTETRARIFDPFFSTKAEGRGLGLAAVKGVVDAHGWVLNVSNGHDQGTTFTLLLPHTEVPCADGQDDSLQTTPTATRILAVDDEPGVLKVVTRILERAGMDVIQARDGQEAIDAFLEHQDSIDCVLLDLNMPKLDGEEVFRELKKIRKDVRVLLSSGFTEQEVLDRFRGAGLAGVVQKPVRMATLLQKIEEAMA